MEKLSKIDLHVKYLNKLVIFIITIVTMSSCKSDRFSHEDKDYIYVWEYSLSGDSVLSQYHKPRTVEYRVTGGRHRSGKNKTHRIYVNKTVNPCESSFEVVRLYSSRYPDRCDIVDRAQKAERNQETLIGIFKETFYPHYELEFIKYK